MEPHGGIMIVGWQPTYFVELVDKDTLFRKNYNFKIRCGRQRKIQEHCRHGNKVIVSRYQSPTLSLDEGSEPTFIPHVKAQLLHLKLLCRHHDAEDIMDNFPTVPIRRILWDPISINEAFKVTCQVTSTSSGRDELNVNSIRLAWPFRRKNHQSF